MINIVVAMAKNNVIGGENKLLWYLPADMRFFRLLTTNHIVIMGRKTYDSIGKPLPNRENIVISRAKNIIVEGCLIANSLENAIVKANDINRVNTSENQKQIFIIGGEQIYKLSMDMAEKLYITEVDGIFEGDAFFPKIDFSKWQETNRINHKIDDKNSLNYAFVEYNLLKK
jgi:dihydrofolate reductase